MRLLAIAFCSTLASGPFVIGLHAQQALPLMPHLDHLDRTPEGPTTRPPRAKPKPVNGTNKSSVVQLGRSQNAYSMQRPSVNQLHHVPALDAVVFVRRENPADHGGTLTRSSLRFDHSLNNGSTWQLGTLLTPAMFGGSVPGNGIRHPNGFLYNPPGNTDPANAHVVAQAPAVSGTNNFRQQMSATAGLNSGVSSETYEDLWPGQSTGWVHGLQWAANGHAWSIVTNVDTANQAVSRGEFKVQKGTWNSNTQAMEWSVAATLTDVFHTYESSGQNFLLNVDWNIAFSPDGQTGYAVVVGKLDVGPPASTYPIVWRSTDAGGTWVQQPAYDFSQAQVFIDKLFPANGSGLVRPYFNNASITVDASGHLHLFSHVYSGFHSSPDSANWIFAAPASQTLVHARTADGAEWTVTHVADVINTDGDLWGGNAIRQDIRPQLARTANGAKLFLAWSASVEEESNILPDILARAYDVNTGLYSAQKNLTQGTGAELGAYWFQLAPTVITGGGGPDYELPLAYCEPGNTDLLPATAWYLKGVGFNEAEINVGIGKTASERTLVLFPNPGDGRFTLDRAGAGAADLWITDSTGRVLHRQGLGAGRQTIDASHLPAGVYTVHLADQRGMRSATLVVERRR